MTKTTLGITAGFASSFNILEVLPHQDGQTAAKIIIAAVCSLATQVLLKLVSKWIDGKKKPPETH